MLGSDSVTPEFGTVAADRNRDPFVAQYDFRDPRRDHANAVLAGANALDDRDIRVPDFALDVGAKLVKVVVALLR